MCFFLSTLWSLYRQGKKSRDSILAEGTCVQRHRHHSLLSSSPSISLLRKPGPDPGASIFYLNQASERTTKPATEVWPSFPCLPLSRHMTLGKVVKFFKLFSPLLNGTNSLCLISKTVVRIKWEKRCERTSASWYYFPFYILTVLSIPTPS